MNLNICTIFLLYRFLYVKVRAICFVFFLYLRSHMVPSYDWMWYTMVFHFYDWLCAVDDEKIFREYIIQINERTTMGLWMNVQLLPIKDEMVDWVEMFSSLVTSHSWQLSPSCCSPEAVVTLVIAYKEHSIFLNSHVFETSSIFYSPRTSESISCPTAGFF